MPIDLRRLGTFLVEAKRRTYAGTDDEATVSTPLLPGSKQLEHRAADLHYRDIYCGMGFFVGQEIVSQGDRPIWSMSYSGGTSAGVTERKDVLAVYAFLRQALMKVSTDLPYRGPAAFDAGGMGYTNAIQGDLARFHGRETIARSGATLFELHYSGGLLR